MSHGQILDNNGLPADSRGFNGPTWRGLDEGVGTPGYFGNEIGSLRPPQSKTLPGVVTPSISLLQELDNE